MILDIDTAYLIKYNLSAHQYTIARLVGEGNWTEVNKYLKASGQSERLREDWAALYNAGYVTAPPGSSIRLTDMSLTTKFKKSHAFGADPFDELFELYPIKVMRPNGSYDYLRVDQHRCRKMYHNIIRRNPALHEHIILCLRAEIHDRSLKNNMPFMKRMPSWLSSEAWQSYADFVESNDMTTLEQKEVGYGEEME